MAITTIYGTLEADKETGKYYSENFHRLETDFFAGKTNWRERLRTDESLENQILDRNILRARMQQLGKGVPTYIPQRERAFAPNEKFNKKFVSKCF